MSEILQVESREYKVMLNHRLFVDRKPAAEALCDELHVLASRIKGVTLSGEFKSTDKRIITLLDTIDETIRLNRLVFRQRLDLESGVTEYTLKCRSPDRYIAAGASLEQGKGFKKDSKFEEDIASPFVVRFSQSNTIEGPPEAPQLLQDAAKLFPQLGKLERDGKRCPGDLELRPVNALQAYERVLRGPELDFEGTRATIALILWSGGKDGRPLVAEFSFRYKDKQEEFPRKTALAAMDFYEELQLLDWCLPDARTKTQFAYRE